MIIAVKILATSFVLVIVSAVTTDIAKKGKWVRLWNVITDLSLIAIIISLLAMIWLF